MPPAAARKRADRIESTMKDDSRRRFLQLTTALALGAAGHALARPRSARSLMDLAHDLLSRLRAAELREFLADWPKESAPHRNISPTGLPVLRWLMEIGNSPPEFSAALIERLVALSA